MADNKTHLNISTLAQPTWTSVDQPSLVAYPASPEERLDFSGDDEQDNPRLNSSSSTTASRDNGMLVGTSDDYETPLLVGSYDPLGLNSDLNIEQSNRVRMNLQSSEESSKIDLNEDDLPAIDFQSENINFESINITRNELNTKDCEDDLEDMEIEDNPGLVDVDNLVRQMDINNSPNTLSKLIDNDDDLNELVLNNSNVNRPSSDDTFFGVSPPGARINIPSTTTTTQEDIDNIVHDLGLPDSSLPVNNNNRPGETSSPSSKFASGLNDFVNETTGDLLNLGEGSFCAEDAAALLTSSLIMNDNSLPVVNCLLSNENDFSFIKPKLNDENSVILNEVESFLLTEEVAAAPSAASSSVASSSLLNDSKVAPPCFEEETRSSWSLDQTPAAINKVPILKLKVTHHDGIKNIVVGGGEESQGSSNSQLISVVIAPPSSTPSSSNINNNKRRYSDEELIANATPSLTPSTCNIFGAQNIFEYQWPIDCKGDFFILQEQISEYLEVKSFKRKYPDLQRRNVEIDERQYLRERNVVSETQCDLGLTALRSEDVLELMSRDYVEKYQEYIRVLQEKQRQAVAIKNKEYASSALDRNKLKETLRKAIRSAAEYNSHLNQERREERRTSFDLQTYTIHVPASKCAKLDPETTKVGRYPVALLPGQFQDYYRRYTPQELKYLPINSVLYGPVHEINSKYVSSSGGAVSGGGGAAGGQQHSFSDGSQSDSDDSFSEEGSCCSSSQGTQDSGDSSSSSEINSKSVKSNANEISLTATASCSVPASNIKDKSVANCKVCHCNREKNKQGQSEDLIHCSECKTSGHPSCLELTVEMVSSIKTYAWQCMDCKTCMLCMDPYDEDKMMFCDKCDRGFHTFCVGLKSLPCGRWICQLCGQCSNCGSKTPGPEGSKLQWQQATGEINKHPQLLCIACTKTKKR